MEVNGAVPASAGTVTFTGIGSSALLGSVFISDFMIYKFHGGPCDGEEKSIPEMPRGAIYRVPLPCPNPIDMLTNPIFSNKCDLGQDMEMLKLRKNEAHYQVGGIGDLHFFRYA
jgi:hypothetical protein